MRYIKEFDPWKNELCKCPPKYTFNPYTGCRFSCRYCYITSYIKDGFRPRVKEIDFYTFEKEVSKISKDGRPLALSLSTDAYQPLESKYMYTRRILKILGKYDIPTLITTKSSQILRDLDLLENMNVAISITITTLNEDIASKLEPYAPRPSARVYTLEKLVSRGIPVTVRIDPIIPSITDDLRSITDAIKLYRDIGVRHIVASIYKVKPDNLRRILEVYPDFITTYRRIYNPSRRIKGYIYPDPNYTFRILSQIRDITMKNGLTFNTCRDGFEFLDSIGCYCDSSHMLKPIIK